jgi:DNA repair exonuclease SbcCD ATPase subunit
MHAKLELMKRRQSGIKLENEMSQLVIRQVKSLEERTEEIASVLLPRLEQSQQQIAALTEKTIKTMGDESLFAANQEKLKQIETLRAIKKDLEDALPEMQKSLENEKQEKAALLKNLEEFREVLKNASALNCHAALHQLSERGSYRIANEKNPPVSLDTRNKEMIHDRLTRK